MWFYDKKKNVQACAHKCFGGEVNYNSLCAFQKNNPITELQTLSRALQKVEGKCYAVEKALIVKAVVIVEAGLVTIAVASAAVAVIVVVILGILSQHNISVFVMRNV